MYNYNDEGGALRETTTSVDNGEKGLLPPRRGTRCPMTENLDTNPPVDDDSDTEGVASTTNYIKLQTGSLSY